MVESISQPRDLSVPGTYCILDADGQEILGRVQLTGLDDNLAYGLDPDSGSRIRIDPVDQYLSELTIVDGQYCRGD